jgi:hypothetical protein
MKPEEIKLAQYIDELSVSYVKFTKLGEDILQANNQARYIIDSFAYSVINRTIQLTQGYITLVNANNYIAAIPLIRLQLDNALRFFAINLVTDANDFFFYFMDGKPVNRYKSHAGEKLSDNYLATTLDTISPGVLRLYKETCDYIHLSKQHIHASKYFDKGEVKLSVMDVDHPIDAFSLEAKVNFALNMLEVGKLVFIVLDRWKRLKQNFPIPDRNSIKRVEF